MSTDPYVLTVQRAPQSIVISQAPSGSLSGENFAYILRRIVYSHSTIRPLPGQYFGSVSVSAFDGNLTSQVAVTTITLNVNNGRSSVLINEQARPGVASMTTVFDGETTIPILEPDDVIQVMDDTSVIQEVSITLTNPADSGERLVPSLPTDLPPRISVGGSGTRIVFTGPATPQDFSTALTDTTIQYQNPAMDSILQGERPSFDTR